MKDKLWILGYVVLIAALVIGYVYGGEELRSKMMATGILALVTGIPAVLISVAKGSKTDQSDNSVETIEDTTKKEVLSDIENTHNEVIDCKEPVMGLDSIEKQSTEEPLMRDTTLPLDELNFVKRLHDEGLITEEEFIQKKRQLLKL